MKPIIGHAPTLGRLPQAKPTVAPNNSSNLSMPHGKELKNERFENYFFSPANARLCLTIQPGLTLRFIKERI
jgi:hypothetical protein